MDSIKERRVMRILWLTSLLPFILGILMMDWGTVETEYSTSEYWVAKDYHHVYQISNGEIVDLITDGETCKIEGDLIIVKQRNAVYEVGFVMSILFGFYTACVIFAEISNSDWWDKLTDSFRN